MEAKEKKDKDFFGGIIYQGLPEQVKETLNDLRKRYPERFEYDIASVVIGKILKALNTEKRQKLIVKSKRLEEYSSLRDNNDEPNKKRRESISDELKALSIRCGEIETEYNKIALFYDEYKAILEECELKRAFELDPLKPLRHLLKNSEKLSEYKGLSDLELIRELLRKNILEKAELEESGDPSSKNRIREIDAETNLLNEYLKRYKKELENLAKQCKNRGSLKSMVASKDLDLKVKLAKKESVESDSRTKHVEKEKVRSEAKDSEKSKKAWDKVFIDKKKSARNKVLVANKESSASRKAPTIKAPVKTSNKVTERNNRKVKYETEKYQSTTSMVKKVLQVLVVIAIIFILGISTSSKYQVESPKVVEEGDNLRIRFVAWDLESDSTVQQNKLAPIVNRTVWVLMPEEVSENFDNNDYNLIYSRLLGESEGYQSDKFCVSQVNLEQLSTDLSAFNGEPSSAFNRTSYNVQLTLLSIEKPQEKEVTEENSAAADAFGALFAFALKWFWVIVVFMVVLLLLPYLFSKSARCRSFFQLIKKHINKLISKLPETLKKVVKFAFYIAIFIIWVISLFVFNAFFVSIAFSGLMAILAKIVLSKSKKVKRIPKLERLGARTKAVLCALFFLVFSILSIVFVVLFDFVYLGLLCALLTILSVSFFMPNAGGENRKKENCVRIFWLGLALILFPTVLGWFQLTLDEPECPAAQFALVPQEYRSNGVVYKNEELSYSDSVDNVGEISFNSKLVLKFNLTIASSKKIKFFAVLKPEEIEESYDYPKELFEKTRVFSTKNYWGPFNNKDFYLEVDLADSGSDLVLPGKYNLKTYFIEQYLFAPSKTSSVREYDLTVEKDQVSIVPYYTNNPMELKRKGCIFSNENPEVLGWDYYYEAVLEDSLGTPVQGTVGLYLTQRNGFVPELRKIKDFETINGKISYVHSAHNRPFRDYMEGMISYNGSYLYKPLSKLEDCEDLGYEFDFPFTADNLNKYTTNGTDYSFFSKDKFRKTSRLFYFTNFNCKELQWTKFVNAQNNPTYSYSSNPDFIYVNFKKDNANQNNNIYTYIESPEIFYIGTVAKSAVFSYKYELFKFVSGNHDEDGIYAKIKVEVFRDNKKVYEQFDYQGYYNEIGENWKTINVPLTEYFTEGGQKFRFRIIAEFAFEEACDDTISLRFDWAKMEANYAPVCYFGYNFQNGVNDFASQTQTTSEATYWDVDRPFTVGREILSYDSLSGLVTNNQFDANFGVDRSWNGSSGIFSQDSNQIPTLEKRNELDLTPKWGQNKGNGFARFDFKKSSINSNYDFTYGAIEADFIPIMYCEQDLQARPSVYFDVDLTLENSSLELISGDRIRLMVLIENAGKTIVLLDTGFVGQNLSSWIRENVGSYYPRYLRYYYNLPLEDLSYSEIVLCDDKVKKGVFPLEASSDSLINFKEKNTLKFVLIKSKWIKYDYDVYQIGIDNVDLSLEVIPKYKSYFQEDPKFPNNNNYLEYPEEFYTLITDYNVIKGTILAGDLNSLNKVDNNDLTIQTNLDSGLNKINVEFNYGCDLNFQSFPMDYYDGYLYVDIDSSNLNPNDIIYFQGYTHNGIEYEWKNIFSFKGGPIHIQSLNFSRVFKFRIVANLRDAESIFVDRIAIINAHQGSFEIILDKIISFTNDASWLAYIESSSDWYKTFGDNQRWVTTSSFYDTAWIEAGVDMTMYLEDGYLIKVKQISNGADGLQFHYHVTIGIGYWYEDGGYLGHSTDTYLYSKSKGMELVNSQGGGQFSVYGGSSYSSAFYDQDINLRLGNYISQNLQDYIYSNVLTQKNWFKYRSNTRSGRIADQSYWWVKNFQDYASINLSVVGFGFSGRDYPNINNIRTIPNSFFPSAPINVIGKSGVFELLADVSSGHKNSVVPSNGVKFFIQGDSWNSGWNDMSYKFGTTWNAQINPRNLGMPFGNYSVFVKATDSMGLSTLSSYNFSYYNEVPKINFVAPKENECINQPNNYKFQVLITDFENNEINSSTVRFQIIDEKSLMLLDNWKLLNYFGCYYLKGIRQNIYNGFFDPIAIGSGAFKLVVKAGDNASVNFNSIPFNAVGFPKHVPYPPNYKGFGVLIDSENSGSNSLSKFLLANKLNLNDLQFITDKNLDTSKENFVDLEVNFELFGTFISQYYNISAFPMGSLECELILAVPTESNPDLVISEEINYDSWTGYGLKDLKLDEKWSKNFGTLYYSLNISDYTIKIYDKDQYFELSDAEEQDLFNLLRNLYQQSEEEVYLIFKLKVAPLSQRQDKTKSDLSLNLFFKGITFSFVWNNGTKNIQEYAFSQDSNPYFFFEKESKTAFLNLIDDLNANIDGREDLIAFYTESNAYYPAGIKDSVQYYLPSFKKQFLNASPAELLNFVNLRLSDCVGLYDAYSNLIVDGPSLMGNTGLVTPNLKSSEKNSYSLRAILKLYPYFRFSNGSDNYRSLEQFKSELLKFKLELFDEFNSKILSKYFDTMIEMKNFDDSEFVKVTNEEGVDYYYLKDGLKLYAYGKDVIVSTNYVYLKLIAELFDSYYVSNGNSFKNQWGVFLDDFKLEFIQDQVTPEFVNLKSGDAITGTQNVIVKAKGDDMAFALLYFDYCGMGGPFEPDFLIANVTTFYYKDGYCYFNFTWNTAQYNPPLRDDSNYGLTVVMKNKIGLKGNATINDLTVVNSLLNTTTKVFETQSGENWVPVNTDKRVSGYIKLTTRNDNPIAKIKKINYYLSDQIPSESNRDKWIKIVELSGEHQDFDYVMSCDSVPNGSWYVVSEAFSMWPNSTIDMVENRLTFNHFENAIQIDDVISLQDEISLKISEIIESKIESAEFVVKTESSGDWILLGKDVQAPFSTDFIGLPYGDTTKFNVLIRLKLNYPSFGTYYVDLTKNNILFDRTGPTLTIVEDPTTELYQIRQADGNWIASTDFDGIISGKICSESEDFESYRIIYNYGKGWITQSYTYNSEEELNWDIRFIPDGLIEFTIIGYDSFNNPSQPLQFSFVKDTNNFDDLEIDGYSYSRIYDISKPVYFRVYPKAQDIETLDFTYNGILYPFYKTKGSDGIYFEREIQFNPVDFDLDKGTVGTLLLSIQASDLRSHQITQLIPFTAALTINGEVEINDYQIFEDYSSVPNQPVDFSLFGNTYSDFKGNFNFIDNNYTSFYPCHVVFSEDFKDSTNSWNLFGLSDQVIATNQAPTDDSYVSGHPLNAPVNFGYSSNLVILDADPYIYSGEPFWTYIKWEYPYLDKKIAQSSILSTYYSGNWLGWIQTYSTNNFDENTITWNNKPSLIEVLASTDIIGSPHDGGSYKDINLGKPSKYYCLYPRMDLLKDSNDQWLCFYRFYSSEHYEPFRPYIKHYFSKSYQGSGMLYCQTDETERLTLRSPNNLNLNLNYGDIIEIKFNTTTSNQINLNLRKAGVEIKSLILSNQGNTNFNTRTVKLILDKSISIDQMEFSGMFSNPDNLIIDDIKIYRNLVNFTALVHVNEKIPEYANLFYSFKTNISQKVNISIWDFTNQKWLLINEITNCENFEDYSYVLDKKSYYNAEGDILFRIVGLNLISRKTFSLKLDKLKVEYQKQLPKDSILSKFSCFYANITSKYSNIHNISYYKSEIKLTGTYFKNEYNFELRPNVELDNIANLSVQTFRSVDGLKFLRINKIPTEIVKILKIYIDTNLDSKPDKVLGADKFFYYINSYGNNRDLFVYFDDGFVENTFYNVFVEYLYSKISPWINKEPTKLILNRLYEKYPFFSDIESNKIVSDIYKVEISVYDVHNAKIASKTELINIDYNGPRIVPLFTNRTFSNPIVGQISFEIIDSNGVDSVKLEILDNNWRTFSGQTERIGDVWTFKFNEPELEGKYFVRLVSSDSLGYQSVLDDYCVYFDKTPVSFLPETLSDGYLFKGGKQIVVKNPTGSLFNKAIRELRVYCHSSFVDLGQYYNLPENFNDFVIDSSIIPDGEHSIYFEGTDAAYNRFSYSFPILVDNVAPEIKSVSLDKEQVSNLIYFNDNIDLKLDMDDFSEISSAKLKVLKILGDPAIYYGDEWFSVILKRNSGKANELYVSPFKLVYSFRDYWVDDKGAHYENVLNWSDQEIPFLDLNVISIEEIVSSQGVSIPFTFDWVAQEIIFDERYRDCLVSDLILKGVKCNTNWSVDLSLNGDSWELTNFDVASFAFLCPELDWYDNLFGFINDPANYYFHYDFPQKYARDRFDYYFEVSDVYGNVMTTQIYRGIYDNIAPCGSFGKISGDGENGNGYTKNNYWELGLRDGIGTLLFGSNNPEHRTLYFTPGYVLEDLSESYYITNDFLFLESVERIMLYNSSNCYIGDMILDSTTTPFNYYKFELSDGSVPEGLSYVKAEVIDKAHNTYTNFQKIYSYKEKPYELSSDLNFGDSVYYEKDRDYITDPHVFNGFLSQWTQNENKSALSVEMSYWDQSESIWVPMGTTEISDGNFQIKWSVPNDTLSKLLTIEYGYIPINYTRFSRPNTYFYGSYGYFGDSEKLSPFLIDLDGYVYVYSYNSTLKQWYVNKTITLGTSLRDKVVSNLDLNRDGCTDLILFDKKSSSREISIYTFNQYSRSFNLRRIITPETNINYPFNVSNLIFSEYTVELTDLGFSVYLCVSSESEGVNFIAKVEFDFEINPIKEATAVQYSSFRKTTIVSIIEEKVYIGALNSLSNLPVSSVFTFDKTLDSKSFAVFENSTKGLISEISTFRSELGQVLVIGISMEAYNEDDKAYYLVYDKSKKIWYKTSFSIDYTLNSYPMGFRIREIVKSKEDYYESALISTNKGIYKTTLSTDVVYLDVRPIFYAVDTLRKWDVEKYEIEGQNIAIIPLKNYPIIEVVSVYEIKKIRDESGKYVWDEVSEIDPEGYLISYDKKSLICSYDSWKWNARSELDKDTYFEVRYRYRASVAEQSGFISSNYKTEEYTHAETIGASNAYLRADKLKFQLQNPFDPNVWLFDYGTSVNNWNYQFNDVTTGNPYTLSKKGTFKPSGITSANAFSYFPEFSNLRMNYQPIVFQGNEVFTEAELSQFETAQDFYEPESYQNLYSNSYIDSVWAENLTVSTSIDMRTDLPDFSSLANQMKPNLVLYDRSGKQIDLGNSIPYYVPLGNYLIDIDAYCVDIPVKVDHNDDSESIEYILLSLALAHSDSNYMRVSLIKNDGTLIHFTDINGADRFDAYVSGGRHDMQTRAFGDAIYSDLIYVNGKYYFKPSNEPSKANFVEPSDNHVEDGVFTRISQNIFRFEYEDEEYEEIHYYDYNYLRLDTSELYNFVKDGLLKIRISLREGLGDNYDFGTLYVKPTSCVIFSDKDNLNSEHFDLTGTANAKKGYKNGLLLSSGGIKLNDLNAYPKKSYLDNNKDVKYRFMLRTDDTFNAKTGKFTNISITIGSSKTYTYAPNNNFDSPIIDDLYDLYGREVDTLSYEVTYNKEEGWKCFVNGLADLGYRGQFDTCGELLIPEISVNKGDQIEIYEIKSQLFNKIDYTQPIPDWSMDYNDVETVNVNAGNGYNNLEYADASLDREIIYNFNDNIGDIGEAFEDARIWADIDYTTQIESSLPWINDPNYPLYLWNYDNSYYYTAIRSSGGYTRSASIDDIYEVDRSDNDEHDPPMTSISSLAEDKVYQLLKWDDDEHLGGSYYCALYGGVMELKIDEFDDFQAPFDNYDWEDFERAHPGGNANIFIYDVGISYEIKFAAQMDNGVDIDIFTTFERTNSENDYISFRGAETKYVEDWNNELLPSEFKKIENSREFLSAGRYDINKYDVNTVCGSDGLINNYFNYALTYTDDMKVKGIGATLDTGSVWWEKHLLEFDQLSYELRLGNEPVTFQDNLYGKTFSAPNKTPFTQFYVTNDQYSKSVLSQDSQVNFENLYTKKQLGLTDVKKIIYGTSFGKNSLSYGVSSKIWYPKFVTSGNKISASVKINDFRLVPDLKPYEGGSPTNHLGESLYPYQTSWWNQQEFCLALPFNVTFSDMGSTDLENIADIIVKVDFGVSVKNFDGWSWRPNLKIFDPKNKKWLPYRADVFAYNNEEDKVVWDYVESNQNYDDTD